MTISSRPAAILRRAGTLSAAVAVGVVFCPLALAGLLLLALISLGAALPGGERG